MQHIKSINNPQVKNWRKLQNRKEREKTKTYLIEGFHLIEEAIYHQKHAINKIMLREDLVGSTEVEMISKKIGTDQLVVITKQIADGISETETNQGLFAEMKIIEEAFPTEITAPFLFLDAVQDPGNVGTMIRTADAAGFQGVVLGKGTVDLYNDKTLRAAQGSHLHLEIYQGDLVDFIEKFKKNELQILGTELNPEAKSYKDVEAGKIFGLVLGNEGVGVSEKVLNVVDQTIYIPMKGHAESLNVAIAASILMFHLN